MTKILKVKYVYKCFTEEKIDNIKWNCIRDEADAGKIKPRACKDEVI